MSVPSTHETPIAVIGESTANVSYDGTAAWLTVGEGPVWAVHANLETFHFICRVGDLRG